MLVSNVQCLGAQMTPDQAWVQSAMKTDIQDQFPGIINHVFAGRDDRATPFASSKLLMTKLNDFCSNTMRTHAPRLALGPPGGKA